MRFNPRHRLLILLILSLFSLSFFGCASKTKYGPGSSAPVSRGTPESGEVKKSVTLLPWEVWPLNRTLLGNSLKNRLMLQADEILKQGDRKAALDLYFKIPLAGLSAEEIEALTIRIASTQLGVDQPVEALSTLSKFFLTIGRSEAEVSPPFSLIFAYAYGRRGDIDQSLAWFARVNRLATRDQYPPAGNLKDATYLNSAEQGARLLLRSIPEDQLGKVITTWTTDSFIHGLVGQEQKRRAAPNYQQVALGGRPFWSIVAGSDLSSSEQHAQDTGALSNAQNSSLGVLLPLTGQFASLGNATKNGIDLALSVSMGGETATPVSYRDDAGDTLQAVASARELFANSSTAFLLGPLLTSSADRVGEVARESRRPMLTFSKGSDFQTGEGVFRLGPTPQTQIDSLLEACEKYLHLTRYALVYPDDVVGQEFARVFRNGVRALGREIVLDRSFPKGSFDSLQGIADELEKSQVEGIFYPDTLLSASRFFAAFSPELREQMHPLGIASWDNRLELQQSRTALEGAIFVSPFYSESQRPSVMRFVSDYQARFQQKPDFLAAQGFDAATIAIAALEKHRAQGTSVVEALQDVDLYEGLTGKVRVQANGEFDRRFAVLALQNGKLSELGLGEEVNKN